MTTTISITTSANPVSVNLYGGGNENREPHRRSWDNSSSVEFVPPETTREFYISGQGSINVQELPAECRDLDHADELRGANAGSATSALG